MQLFANISYEVYFSITAAEPVLRSIVFLFSSITGFQRNEQHDYPIQLLQYHFIFHSLGPIFQSFDDYTTKIERLKIRL